MASGAGSSGAGRGRGTPSLNDKSGDNKDAKPNPKMSKALSTSAKRFVKYESYHRKTSILGIEGKERNTWIR